MFVQTFATVRLCIPPFLTCCLFEANCAYNFKAQRGAIGRGPKKGAKDVGYLESDELSSTKGPATGPLRASRLRSSHLHASHGGSHATERGARARLQSPGKGDASSIDRSAAQGR